MPEFSGTLVDIAWRRSEGYCECIRMTHGHLGTCHKTLIKSNRGKEEGLGAWEAHSKSRLHVDTLSDCEILCWTCHELTL